MGDLTKDFSRWEFRCPDCDLDTVDYELVVILQKLRDYYGAKVTVTSGARCKAENRRVGGALSSYHLRCRAADVVVEGVRAAEVQAYLATLYPDRYGIGMYETYTHIDSRRQAARWS